MDEQRKGRQTPTQSIVLPYTKTYGNEAVDIYNTTGSLNDPPKMVHRSTLKKAIRSYESNILEHEDKIRNPEKYISDWGSKDIREQNGLKKHWQKEINNFNKSINDRIEELKKRGDYDE